MPKRWFCKSFCGGTKEPELRTEALQRAVHFLNQCHLDPINVKITEGLTISSGFNMRECSVYEVTVFYMAEQELFYKGLNEV